MRITIPSTLLTLVGDSVRTPVGNIHRAGTETATSWIGLMNGAVQAGERVSTEVATAQRGDLTIIRTGPVSRVAARK